MFDIGFSEILVIAVVALLALGPERLPKAARFAGLWMRRARTQWNSVKAELESELVNEELRLSIRQVHSELHDGLNSTRESIRFTSANHSPPEHVAPEKGATRAVAIEPLAIDGVRHSASPPNDQAQTAITLIPHDASTSDITRAQRFDTGSTDG
jgi:sec-independent protein translocase protein TatB